MRSYGFRPGRSAHQAVRRAQEPILAGFDFVVDLDLEKFFDRVNHDILMGLVAKRVADKRLLRLVRGFLTAGVLDGGLVGPTTKGTPQGGPLSPLLSNLMLDVLDKELEKRGHRFVRYADDCNTYVRSRRAGERVMASVTNFLARRLKLTVNAAKSAVDRPSARAFLAFSFTAGPTPQRVISPKALARFKLRVRELTRRTTSVGFTPSRGGAVPLPRRVAGLLRILRGPLCPAPPRPVDTAAASRRRLEALEAWAYPLRGAAPPRGQQDPGGQDRQQRPMARGGSASARRSASRCPTLSSTESASHPSPQAMPPDSVEPPWYGPVRTVVVGGAEPRGSPLSRFRPYGMTAAADVRTRTASPKFQRLISANSLSLQGFRGQSAWFWARCVAM